MGQSMRIFRKEMKGLGDDKAAEKAEKPAATEDDSNSTK
jgi:Sec-independent protein translocase protein TatA